MSKDDDHPHRLTMNDQGLREAQKAAALLELDNHAQAISLGLTIVLEHAKSCARGKTEIIHCTPKFKTLVENNLRFFEALCEEGVVEWLTPFVLTKSKQSAPNTTQP
jgi:hypothetical protein